MGDMDQPRTVGLAALERRHVEGPYPSYQGKARVGSQCVYCNRTWPCDAARLIEQLRAAASRPAVRDGLQEALIPLASRMADHLFHPEDHDPKDECWIDLYRTIVGMDGPLADKGSREASDEH